MLSFGPSCFNKGGKESNLKMNSPDVVVIAQYSGDGPNSNNRFREICSGLAALGIKVELVTSNFFHAKKRHLDLSAERSSSFEVIQIDEPGYRKNISVRRILSHRKLAQNLKEYLEIRRVPDVIYCAVPSLDVAEVAVKYANRRGVKLIFDVQDLWPEAFEMVLKPKSAAKIILAPLRKKADRIYRSGDAIVTVSQTYSRRVMAVRSDPSTVKTVYLGTRLKSFDDYTSLSCEEESSVLQLVYIGTLGRSYDLPLVFDALRELRRRQIDFQFHIMGSGPLESQWKELASDLANHVVFYGRLPYGEMVSRLKSCDVAINPIVPGSAGSIINKVCDYAAAGLPVVNTQESEEYRNLLGEYRSGINCDPTAQSVANAISALNQDENLRKSMGQSSREMAVELFDRDSSYRVIWETILSET